MRMRTTKYGSLNAWEVAYFRGAFERADIDGDGFRIARCGSTPRLIDADLVLRLSGDRC
jgi:hypothetical protein